MSHTLEQFATRCHDMLKAHPGPAGRQQVCTLLQEVLKDETFVTTYLGDDVPERQVLYEDPELGFCIRAHVYADAKESPPHDHGPSWAIYGQGRGETDMTDWELVTPATEQTPGKVRRARTYTLTPGTAYVYHEGQVHSPRRAGATRLIRLEGMNMEKVRRLRYEAV
jgi:predicted metal-dependent enzyme (double-stranded beta helix superfamily)